MLDVSRKEKKYLVSEETARFLAAKIEPVLKRDIHSKQDGYLVRSLYFDTVFDSDFEAKVDGYDNRHKIRIRIYSPEDTTAKLELKEKSGDSQRKRSLTLSRDEAVKMSQCQYDFLLLRPEPLAKSLYTLMMTKCYKPKCIVEYDRVAYIKDENETRVTFDKRLRGTEASFDLFDKNLICYPVADPAEVTMEVKFNGYLYSYVKSVLNVSDRMLVSNSKYCRCRTLFKAGRR